MFRTATTEPAQVVQCRSAKWMKNHASGHEWPEYVYIKRWRVVGGHSLGQELFRSEVAAQEHAAWLNSL